MPDLRLMTAKEVAEICDLKRDTLLAHVRGGNLRYVLIGHGAQNKHSRFRTPTSRRCSNG